MWFFHQQPIVHLSSDLNCHYFDESIWRLPGDPAYTALPAETRAFADQLFAHDVSTLWIALGGIDIRSGFYRAASWQGRRAELDEGCAITGRERIFIKTLASDAFHREIITKSLTKFHHGGRKLKGYLGRRGTSMIILSGLQPGDCIPATAAGALEAGYRVIVVSDLLGRSDPELTKGWVLKEMPRGPWTERQAADAGLLFMTRVEILAVLKEKPATLFKATPASLVS